MATTQNFTGYAGDTWIRKLKFFQDDGVTPINISAHSFAMELRLVGKKVTALKFTSSPANGITIGGVSSNELNLSFPLLVAGGVYNYDLECIKSDGTVITYIAGTFTITQDYTNGIIK